MHSVRSDSLCHARRDPQFLWKTLWKRPRYRRVTRMIPNKSADCTIHGALQQQQAKYYIRSTLVQRAFDVRSPYERHSRSFMRIVVADDLPRTALELLKAEGWDVDSKSGRSPEELSTDRT